jgi:hypothetical protein
MNEERLAEIDGILAASLHIGYDGNSARAQLPIIVRELLGEVRRLREALARIVDQRINDEGVCIGCGSCSQCIARAALSRADGVSDVYAELRAAGWSHQLAAKKVVEMSETIGRITRRIARDHPAILERMKAGEYKSVRQAALEAGLESPAEPPEVAFVRWCVERVRIKDNCDVDEAGRPWCEDCPLALPDMDRCYGPDCEDVVMMWESWREAQR